MSNGKSTDIRKKTHENVDRLMDSVENIRDNGQARVDNLVEGANNIREKADVYIRKNPETSLLMAAGAGLVMGALFTAAMMRRRD